MAAEKIPAPALNLRFEVSIDGQKIGEFVTCEGLSAEYEIFEYQEGGENTFIHRLPGRMKYPNIKLTRPVDGGTADLAKWFAAFRETVSRATGSITAFDAGGKQIAKWPLDGVYPVRWTGPNFSAENNGVARETLELAHNGFLSGAGR